MNKQEEIRRFERLNIEDKLSLVFKLLLELREQKNEIPIVFTNRLYTIKEATEHIAMSKEWILKQIRKNKISAKWDKNKYWLTWATILEVKKERENKYS